MELLLARPRELPAAPVDLAVVIDVFRFTTTATILFSRGLGVALALDRPENLAALAEDRYLVFSELGELAHGAAQVDNSPAIAARIDLANRTVVLVTQNGTRALAAAAGFAEEVLIASFLNLRAVATWVARRAPRAVAILPAGDFAGQQPHAEDDYCASALRDLLSGRAPAFGRLFAAIRRHERVAARLRRQPGFAADMRLALRTDASTAIVAATPTPHRSIVELSLKSRERP